MNLITYSCSELCLHKEIPQQGRVNSFVCGLSAYYSIDNVYALTLCDQIFFIGCDMISEESNTYMIVKGHNP